MANLTDHEQALLQYYSNEWRGVPLKVIRSTIFELQQTMDRIGPSDKGYVPLVLRTRALSEYAELLERTMVE